MSHLSKCNPPCSYCSETCAQSFPGGKWSCVDSKMKFCEKDKTCIPVGTACSGCPSPCNACQKCINHNCVARSDYPSEVCLFSGREACVPAGQCPNPNKCRAPCGLCQTCEQVVTYIGVNSGVYECVPTGKPCYTDLGVVCIPEDKRCCVIYPGNQYDKLCWDPIIFPVK